MNELDRSGRLRVRDPIADNGDALPFRSTCAFGSVCMPAAADKIVQRELHVRVEHMAVRQLVAVHRRQARIMRS